MADTTDTTDARPRAEKSRRGNDDGLLVDGHKVEPVGNRGAGDTSSPSGTELPGGSRGDGAKRQQEQDAAIRGKP